MISGVSIIGIVIVVIIVTIIITMSIVICFTSITIIIGPMLDVKVHKLLFVNGVQVTPCGTPIWHARRHPAALCDVQSGAEVYAQRRTFMSALNIHLGIGILGSPKNMQYICRHKSHLCLLMICFRASKQVLDISYIYIYIHIHMHTCLYI